MLPITERRFDLKDSEKEGATRHTSSGDVKSSKRTVQILEILSDSNSSLSLSAISKLTEIPKSSLHGILKTLNDQGWVNFNQDNNSYALGLKSLKVGARFLDFDKLTNRALHLMTEFRDNFGETINLGRFDGYNVVYLSSFESKNNLRKYSRIGRSLPAYATSMGKQILAYMNFDEVAQIYDQPFVQLTSKTVRNLEALKVEIIQAKIDGWSVEREQSSIGFSCVGVAINDQYPPKNALSVSTQKSALTPKYLDKILPELFLIANKIAN